MSQTGFSQDGGSYGPSAPYFERNVFGDDDSDYEEITATATVNDNAAADKPAVPFNGSGSRLPGGLQRTSSNATSADDRPLSRRPRGRGTTHFQRRRIAAAASATLTHYSFWTVTTGGERIVGHDPESDGVGTSDGEVKHSARRHTTSSASSAASRSWSRSCDNTASGVSSRSSSWGSGSSQMSSFEYQDPQQPPEQHQQHLEQHSRRHRRGSAPSATSGGEASAAAAAAAGVAVVHGVPLHPRLTRGRTTVVVRRNTVTGRVVDTQESRNTAALDDRRPLQLQALPSSGTAAVGMTSSGGTAEAAHRYIGGDTSGGAFTGGEPLHGRPPRPLARTEEVVAVGGPQHGALCDCEWCEEARHSWLRARKRGANGFIHNASGSACAVM